VPASKVLRDRFAGAPPLTVLLPPGGQPVMLYGKFTRAELFEKLKVAMGPGPAPASPTE